MVLATQLWNSAKTIFSHLHTVLGNSSYILTILPLQVVNGYFVHFFAPQGFTPIPKDVLFVLDKSGSMHGTKIEQVNSQWV